MAKGHKEPDPPGSDTQQQPLPVDQRLLEIKRRVERGFYDGEPVLKEVAQALVESWGCRRARGGDGTK